MQFSINGVSVFLPFIRVDYDGEEAVGPKCLVPCSPPVLVDGYEFDYNLNLRAGTATVETTEAAPDTAPDAIMWLKNSVEAIQNGLTSHRKERKRELRTHIDTYDNIEKLDGDDLINATRFLKR